MPVGPAGRGPLFGEQPKFEIFSKSQNIRKRKKYVQFQPKITT